MSLSPGILPLLAFFCLTQAPGQKEPPLPPINPGQAKLSQSLGGLSSPGVALAAGELSGMIAAACESGEIHYWDRDVAAGIRSGERTPNVIAAHAQPITAMCWGKSPFLASADVSGLIQLWKMPGGERAAKITAASPVRSLAVSPAGNTLFSGSEDGSIQIWEIPSGRPLAKISGHSEWVLSLAVSSDGKTLASSSSDLAVRIWDVPSGRKLVDAQYRPAPVANAPPTVPVVPASLAFAPDGKQLAIGCSNGAIHMVSLPDGKLQRTLSGHESTVTSLAYHPSGTLLVSTSRDRTVRLWTPAAGQLIKTLDNHTSWVEQAGFLARGTRLATVSADQTVRLWDLR